MDTRTKPDGWGELIEPTTLKIQRLLPGPVERIWAYLTDSELRRKWLAAGAMEMKIGRAVRTGLAQRRTQRPAHRAAGRTSPKSTGCRAGSPNSIRRASFRSPGITAAMLRSNWSRGAKACLLTVTHRRLPDRSTMLKVGAGWHMHLDVLVARANGNEPAPFWEGWSRLHGEYDRRLPV